MVINSTTLPFVLFNLRGAAAFNARARSTRKVAWRAVVWRRRTIRKQLFFGVCHVLRFSSQFRVERLPTRFLRTSEVAERPGATPSHLTPGPVLGFGACDLMAAGVSLCTKRSSSAQTSAIRPEMNIRPAAPRRTALSASRTILRRLTDGTPAGLSPYSGLLTMKLEGRRLTRRTLRPVVRPAREVGLRGTSVRAGCATRRSHRSSPRAGMRSGAAVDAVNDAANDAKNDGCEKLTNPMMNSGWVKHRQDFCCPHGRDARRAESRRQGVGRHRPNARHLSAKNGLHQHLVSDQSDCQPFDFKRLAGLNDDGLKIRVLGQ